MPQFFFKFGDRTLFVSSFLLFLFTTLNLILQSQVKDSYNIYPVLLVFAILFFWLAVFIFSFKALSKALADKKHLLFIGNILLIIGQFWFLYRSLLSLSQTSYIYESVRSIFVADIFFYAQSLLDKELQIKKLLWTNLGFGLFFSLILFLRPNFLTSSNRLILLTQQFISLLILVFHFLVFIKTSSNFAKQD